MINIKFHRFHLNNERGKGAAFYKAQTFCGNFVKIGGSRGTMSDAKIFKQTLSTSVGLRELLKPVDGFVVDRGFKDIKKSLQEESFPPLVSTLKINFDQDQRSW